MKWILYRKWIWSSQVIFQFKFEQNQAPVKSLKTSQALDSNLTPTASKCLWRLHVKIIIYNDGLNVWIKSQQTAMKTLVLQRIMGRSNFSLKNWKSRDLNGPTIIKSKKKSIETRHTNAKDHGSCCSMHLSRISEPSRMGILVSMDRKPNNACFNFWNPGITVSISPQESHPLSFRHVEHYLHTSINTAIWLVGAASRDQNPNRKILLLELNKRFLAMNW